MEPIGAFDSQGTRLAMWVSGFLPNSPNPSLQVWDLQENRQLFIDQDAGGSISAAFFSLDRGTLVTIHTDNVLARFGQSTAEVIGTVCVRDAQSGEIKLKVDGPQAIDAAVTSHGALLAIQFSDRHLEVWSVAESEMLFAHDLPKVESTIVQTADIEFTPDGEQLAVVGNSKGLIELLDLAQIRELLKPIGLSW
jgi:WD40 repeat protein